MPRLGHSRLGAARIGGRSVSDIPGWAIELRKPGVVPAIIPNDELIAESITPEVSAIGRWEATIPDSAGISDWLRADAYVWYDGTLLCRGELDEARSPADGTMTISGPDSIASLEEGGQSVTYRSERVDAAIRDYLNRFTDFAATVYDQDAELVDQNMVVQDET